ncbi:Uncharacterised protein [Candidatus Tiddalikarchaeum anstoanum]|nr:Uncharacterised protein [Candidatus Tiddalikarchaeum anstoanum]
MIRKIQQSGRLHYISLPAEWIRENNLKQGNELIVSSEGRTIILSSQDIGLTKKEINFNTSNTNFDSLAQLVRSCFESGADSIKINLIEKLNDKSINSLKKRIQKDYGLQMIEITKEYIKIQIVMQGSDINSLLNAILSSTLNAFRALLNNDKEMLDSHVEQMQFYRHLIRRTIRLSKKVSSLAIICEELGLIGHELQRCYDENDIKREFHEKALTIFQKLLRKDNNLDDYLSLFEDAKKLKELTVMNKKERYYSIDRIHRSISLIIKELITEEIIKS